MTFFTYTSHLTDTELLTLVGTGTFNITWSDHDLIDIRVPEEDD